MSFLNPWGFLFALSIPAIVLLYLLKQRYQEVEVSSTHLWEKAVRDMQANAPWQKLRKNLLLFLQLAAAAFFTLAIARPFLFQEGRSSEFIVVLDCSASMQAEDVKPSRFLLAKREIEGFIDDLLPGQRVTLIAAGYDAEVVASRSGDKSILKQRLNEIEVTNGQGSMEQALALVQALAKELEDVRIRIYSDKVYQIRNQDIESIVFNNEGKNFAVELVNWSQTPNGTVVLSKIANYSDEDAALAVECLVDGATFDIREVAVPAGRKADVYWTGIPADAKRVEVAILDEDDLAVDNRGWTFMELHKENKVLLVTQRNVFLEKAIALRDDVNLVKTAYEHAVDLNGYALYVFDGYIPSKLPRDGNIVIFNPPPKNGFLEVGEEYVPQNLRLSSHSRYARLLDLVNYEGFNIAKARRMIVPPWAEAVLDGGQGPLIMAGEIGTQRVIAFSFDVHYSDIPLKVDFPILIQNVLAWALPQSVVLESWFYAGQEVHINLLPGAQEIRVITPSGKEFVLDPSYSVVPFIDNHEVGVYTVQQVIQQGDRQEVLESHFTVHVPTHSESDLRAGQVMSDVGQPADVRSDVSGLVKELWRYFAGAVLAVIMLEWWVYQRGY